MYTVYDFINNNIESKHMKFGWKVEIIPQSILSCSPEISLTYTMLNFDWNSLNYLNDEIYNMYLSSESYQNMKEKKERAILRYKRLYFTAFSIEDLKEMVKSQKLKINIDKLINAAIKRKSERIKEKISGQKTLQES